MQFIIRILFSGMMVFVPNDSGTQMDVVLLNVPHGQSISDGTGLPHHKPLILVRGGGCTGTCPTQDAEIAAYVFGDKPTAVAKDSLAAAVSGGGAWVMAGADYTLRKAAGAGDLPALDFIEGVRTSIIPTTSDEREDFSWLAKLSEICPTCGFNEEVLGANPPAGLVAARFRLNSGNVFTYSVARIGPNVKPVHFKRLDGTGATSSYSRAIATFIGTDITVTGNSIDLIETNFNGTAGRTMTLTPDSNGKIEIAVLNLPPLVPATASDASGVGKHFERYYEVADTIPAAAARLVPHPGPAPDAPSYDTNVSWSSVHPQSELWSDLLNAIRLNPSRSTYDISLCPPTRP